jgi:hypothetical protein
MRALPFVLVLDYGLSRWIYPIDFEGPKRVAVDMERVQSVVKASALGQSCAAHRFNFVLSRVVPTFHDHNMLDMMNRAAFPVIEHAGGLSYHALAAAGNGLSLFWVFGMHDDLLYDR